MKKKILKTGIDFVKLSKWITKNWGKKCRTFNATCSTCQVWRVLRELKDFLEF